MDPQIQELKELVRQNIALSAETNKTVHRLRRSMLWGRTVTIIFWLIITLGPILAYYYYFQSYVQPYVQKMEQLYNQVEAGNKQAQSYQSEISNFFGNFAPRATSTPTSTVQ